jgi:hypothetical protein
MTVLITGSQIRLEGPRIFLSYAKEDRQRVRSIYRQLIAHGLSPWIDVADLEPGQDWQQVIMTAIKKARLVLLFLSKVSVTKSGYFQKEISEALAVAETFPQGHKFIIPVRLQNCVVPERISNWHWIDVYRPYGRQRLIQTLSEGSRTTVPNVTQNTRQEIMSAETLTDQLISTKFRNRREFFVGKVPQRGTVISNGAMLEFRHRVTRAFRQACGDRKIRRLTAERTSAILPKEDVYKKNVNVVTGIRWTSEAYLVLEAKSGVRCAVDRDYVIYILRKYPQSTLYVTDKDSVVIVESDQLVQFLVMPMQVSQQDLSNAK